MYLQEAPTMSNTVNGPSHISPAQWQQSIGYSRQSCARVFRDGGTPLDALAAFGLTASASEPANWDRAVDAIASLLCQQQLRRAA